MRGEDIQISHFLGEKSNVPTSPYDESGYDSTRPVSGVAWYWYARSTRYGVPHGKSY